MLNKRDIHNWQRILVPNGRDYAHCAHAFEEKFGISVPVFPERTFTVSAYGKTFIKVKGRDMPNLLKSGFGDVGLVYTDICEEKIAAQSSLIYEAIGSSRLQFCLLLPQNKYEALKERAFTFTQPPLTVATSYPIFLQKCLKSLKNEGKELNIKISDFVPSGAVEAMPALQVADAVADVVNTGASAKANGLVPMHLTNIYPALIYRK